MIKDEGLYKGREMVETLPLTRVLKYHEFLESEVCQDSKE